MEKSIRPYQETAKANVFKLLKKGKSSQMLTMATGCGKTFTGTEIIREGDFKRTLWITHTEELIEQSASTLLPVYGTVGIIKQERMEKDERIVVASIQTIHRRLTQLPSDWFDCIVVDECHYAMAATWQKTINHFNPKLTLGLTATPWRSDGGDLSHLFAHTAFNYDILTGINEGYLCDIKAQRVRTQMNLDDVHTVAGDFNQSELREVVDCPERNNFIVDKYLEHAKGRQAVAFCVDVQHAMNLSQVFNNRGLKANFVVGDKKLCPDRKERIDSFKSGETPIITNVMVLTTGFDHPEVSCVIMATPTKSKTKFVQTVGRGTRLKKGEFKDCIVLDVVDVTRRHRLVNTQTMDEEVLGEEKLFIGSANREEIQRRKDAREEDNRVRVAAMVDEDKNVDLFKLPRPIIDESKFNAPHWKESATPKQLAQLAYMGYPISDDMFYSKRHAFEMIGNKPASHGQMALLRRLGYDVDSEFVSFFQATFVIQQHADEEKWGAGKEEQKPQAPVAKKQDHSIQIGQNKFDF